MASVKEIGSKVSDVAAQVQKGGMSQAQINQAIGSLKSAQSELSSGIASGAIKRGVNYAEFDRPVAMAKAAVITPESITPTPKLPTYKDTTPYQSILASLGLSQPTKDSATGVTEPKSKAQSFMDIQEQIVGKPPSAATAYKEAQQETGLLEKQRVVNDLTGQLNQITSQAQANQLSVVGQGRGIPEAIIGGQQAQIAKEAAIQALPVSASLQAAQGNLEMAQQNLNTLFQIKSQDLTNQYAYKKDLVKSLWDIADKEEQRILAKADKLEERKYTENRDNLKYAQDIAGMAIKTGQGDIARQISALDSKSPTYMQDLMAIQGKIKDPTLSLDIALKNAQINEIRARTAAIGEPTKEEKKAAAQALTEAKASVPVMKDKLSEINNLYTHSGKDARVGQNILMRAGGGLYGVQNVLSGSGSDFAARVHKLTAGMTLDNLIAAKARGATFGALSEGELGLLAKSATALNDWEKKDSNGKGTGVWSIDQGSFDKELDNIKRLTQRALIQSGNSLLGDDEDAILGKVFNSQSMNLDVSNLYR